MMEREMKRFVEEVLRGESQAKPPKEVDEYFNLKP